MTPVPEAIEHVMARALAGDKRAYSDVLHQSARMLRPYLSRRLNNQNAIDDVVQEILVSIHKARHTYDGKRPYRPWLFAIAKFRLRDYLRSHYKDQLYHAGELGDAEFNISGDVTESGFSYESIKEEIRQLPEKQAKILHLMHSEGFTAKEVAHKIGMSESAVKVSAHRAYKLLKKKLGE